MTDQYIQWPINKSNLAITGCGVVLSIGCLLVDLWWGGWVSLAVVPSVGVVGAVGGVTSWCTNNAEQIEGSGREEQDKIWEK